MLTMSYIWKAPWLTMHIISVASNPEPIEDIPGQMQNKFGVKEQATSWNDSIDHRYKIWSTQNVKYNQASGAIPCGCGDDSLQPGFFQPTIRTKLVATKCKTCLLQNLLSFLSARQVSQDVPAGVRSQCDKFQCSRKWYKKLYAFSAVSERLTVRVGRSCG
jgi:hypothetical protein